MKYTREELNFKKKKDIILICYKRCQKNKELLSILKKEKVKLLIDLYCNKLSRQQYDQIDSRCPPVGVYSFIRKYKISKIYYNIL